MILDSLFTIRSALANHRALGEYLVTRYANPCTYAIGKSIPSLSTQYPWIALTLADETRDETRSQRTQRVIIAWFITNGHSEDGLFEGIVESAAIGELILEVLDGLNRVLVGGRTMRIKWETDSFTDLAVNFPFFSAEMQITVHLTEKRF